MDEEEILANQPPEPSSDEISTMSRYRRAQALLTAARRGKAGLVGQLLAAGVEVNTEDEMGCTALMYVAAQGLLGSVDALAARGCVIHRRTAGQQTALHFAAQHGRATCVERLLQLGAMVNASDDWGVTPLMLAVLSGDVDTVRVLLHNGARPEMTDLRGFDAVTYAAREGNAATLQVLLEHGCSVHGRRTSPLHQAASFGHLRCTKLLLAAGALPSVRDIHGQLPIELATQTDQADVVACLLRKAPLSQEDRNAALVSAAKANAMRCLAVLIESGANPETWISGVPTLFLAVAQNNAEAVQTLIKHHCQVRRTLRRDFLVHTELRDLCLNPALQHVCAVTIATLRGYGRLLRILLHAGAPVAPFSRLLAANLVPDTILKDEALMLWVLERATQPLALTELCRGVVREQLVECQAQGQVQDLPIPAAIKDFLCFSEIDVL